MARKQMQASGIDEMKLTNILHDKMQELSDSIEQLNEQTFGGFGEYWGSNSALKFETAEKFVPELEKLQKHVLELQEQIYEHAQTLRK